jgi:peptidoglycan/LPS O-acetylase OafA/YrhL
LLGLKGDSVRVSIPSLTGIRGVAALWVVLFHMRLIEPAPEILKLPVVDQIAGNGWVGVDLFFILSGFILMHTHIGDFAASPAEYAPSFYRSRFFRVFPLNAAVLFLIALLVAADPAFAPNLTATGFLKTLTLSTSWLPVGGDWNEPVWSLSAEIVGYVAFPLLAYLVAKVKRPRLALGIAVSCILALLAQLAHRHSLGDNVIHGPTAMFRMGTEFTAGIALCRMRSLVADFKPAKWFEFGAVVALVGLLFVPRGQALTPFAFAALVYALSFKSGVIDRALSSGPAMFLGRISFPLYLVHLMPLAWLRFHGGGWNIAYLAGMLAVSALLHKYVERPFTRLGRAPLQAASPLPA